jgi:hypothetical protein
VLAEEAARGRAEAELQLAAIEVEKQRRDEALEAELRDRAAMARRALEEARREAEVAAAQIAIPAETVAELPRKLTAPRRGWFQLVRPYTAAGLTAACAFAVATAWIGLQAPNALTVSAVVAQAALPATDAGNVPTLKSIDTLASLDQLEADGALVTR